jgi:hypothetical protein
MVLGVLLILALIPLAGVVWIALFGSLTTVDGIFMSLILLTMSGILGTTALFEMKKRLSGSAAKTGPRAAVAVAGGGVTTKGKVQDVTFFEAHVGEPNKSIVTLADNGHAAQTLVLSGDMRNALPVGQSVKITMRKEGGTNILVNVTYA